LQLNLINGAYHNFYYYNPYSNSNYGHYNISEPRLWM